MVVCRLSYLECSMPNLIHPSRLAGALPAADVASTESHPPAVGKKPFTAPTLQPQGELVAVTAASTKMNLWQ